MIKLFQTPSSKKKNIWHILYEGKDDYITGLCCCSPNQKNFNPEYFNFTGVEKICPSCVGQAYIKGVIIIQEKKAQIETNFDNPIFKKWYRKYKGQSYLQLYKAYIWVRDKIAGGFRDNHLDDYEDWDWRRTALHELMKKCKEFPDLPKGWEK